MNDFARLREHIEGASTYEEIQIKLPVSHWRVLDRVAELVALPVGDVCAVIVALELIKRGAEVFVSDGVSSVLASQIPIPGPLAAFLPESTCEDASASQAPAPESSASAPDTSAQL